MIWLHACPKCSGDLFLTRDLDGPVISCLQCGRSLNQQEELALGAVLPHEKAPIPMTTTAARKEGRHQRRVA